MLKKVGENMFESFVTAIEMVNPLTSSVFKEKLGCLDQPLNGKDLLDENIDVIDRENIREYEWADLDQPLLNENNETIKYGYDDNGRQYTIDGQLLPNNVYSVNGYEYRTDELGRIVEASGELRLKTRENRKTINENMEDIARGDAKETDDRGHLIADQFDGSNKIDNLVPMDANLNRGEFKALENKLASAVEDGKEVKITIEPEYSGDSYRPDRFMVTYSINGDEHITVFENKPTNC